MLMQRWVKDQEWRRATLSSPKGLEAYNHTLLAWRRLENATRFQLAQKVKIPLSLIQVPSFDGRGVRTSSSSGPRGRPPDVVSRPSPLGRLAAGGGDALALRLYLAVIAVAQLSPERVTSIPLCSSGDDPEEISWVSLAHVPRSVRGMRQRRPRAKKPLDTESQQRSRIKDAVDTLIKSQCVIPIRSSRGTIVGLELAPFPQDVAVRLRAGCTDVWLPVTFWLMGWNAVLWADDIINLLAFCSLPETDVYGVPFATSSGRTFLINETTRPGAGRVTGSPLLVPTGKRARWMSRGRRIQQFGIHDVRYVKRADLRRFRLLERLTSPSRPSGQAPSSDDWLDDQYESPTSVPLHELTGDDVHEFIKLVEQDTGDRAVGAYQVNLDVMANDARVSVTRAFETVSARGPSIVLPHHFESAPKS